MPAYNGIGWFEIGADDPAAAERFYGAVFGWTASADAPGASPAYRFITTGDADGLRGGLFATEGKMPRYAVFTVLVEDVEATCRRVEEAGGKIQRAPKANESGVRFAHLLDPSGNHFEVFTPPARP
jgi:predicted enzyme related to lactoylglutathione lyase